VTVFRSSVSNGGRTSSWDGCCVYSRCYASQGKETTYLPPTWSFSSLCATCAMSSLTPRVSHSALSSIRSHFLAIAPADGAMVSCAHKEPIEKRGRIQTHCYSMMSLGKIIMNACLLLGFSGPEMNCAGYEPDATVGCTVDEAVIARVEPALIQSYPADWCHRKCSRATFDFDLPIHTLAMGMSMVIFLSLPLYASLKEEKVQAEPRLAYLKAFWSQLQRKACWQIILCES